MSMFQRGFIQLVMKSNHKKYNYLKIRRKSYIITHITHDYDY